MSDNPTKTQMGYIISTATEMNVPQSKWDVTFHKAVNCAGAKRPTGCKVCEHDTESCDIENCALCQAKKGIPLESGIEYKYPKD